MTADADYSRSVFAIDRDVPKPRKDIAKWDEAKAYSAYFYEELFTAVDEIPEKISLADAKAVLEAYKATYTADDDRQQWFDRIKSICAPLGFAAETSEYKANPDAFKGSVGDVSTVIRIAITGRRNTPDLYSIMQVLGQEKCIERITAKADSISL